MDETDTSIKVIAKGAIVFFIGTIFIKLLTYIYRLIIARAGVEQYGLFSIALAIFTVISTVCIFGMETGLYGIISNLDKKKQSNEIITSIKSATKFSTILSLISAFLLFILADYISLNYFHEPSLSILLKVISIALPFASLRTISFFFFPIL